jgi:hypothetical protein
MNPIVLDVIQGVARLRAAAGEAAQAIEWLSLAAFHPNGEWETKQKAEKALIALSTQIASDESHSIQERGRSAALELVVQDVLIWLNAQ